MYDRTAVGETTAEPGDVVPTAMPLSMSTVAILAPLHASVADPPEVMLAGATISVQEGAPPPPPPPEVTVTVAPQVDEPPAPVTVPVYVVVLPGVTAREPAARGVAAPTPLSMESDVAFAVVQERVEEPPEAMEAGLAARVQVGAGGGGAETAAVQEAVAVCAPDVTETVAVFVPVEP